ncbi:MAG: hypothetical protein ACPGYV_03235 [Phycisphaeraceae bacterium]
MTGIVRGKSLVVFLLAGLALPAAISYFAWLGVREKPLPHSGSVNALSATWIVLDPETPERVDAIYDDAKAWLTERGFEPTAPPTWVHQRTGHRDPQDRLDWVEGTWAGSDPIVIHLVLDTDFEQGDPSGTLSLRAAVDWKDHDRASNAAVMQFLDEMSEWWQSRKPALDDMMRERRDRHRAKREAALRSTAPAASDG